MKLYPMRFQNIQPNKAVVCFTWDDNFSRHSDYIAPAFLQRGIRCTFYINPGEEGYSPKHLENDAALLKHGFEIGSHGYTHENLSLLPPSAAANVLRDAALSIQENFHVYPTTFAFPYHDYNEETLKLARSFHLETRNTLAHSRWFAIKSDIPLNDMLTAVDECVEEKRPLVFSGHSVILTPEELQDEQLKNETGYNPILQGDLIRLLDFLQTQTEHVQVLTFEQAALLAFIRQSGDIKRDTFTVTEKMLDRLKAFGIGIERLYDLM